MTKQYQQGGIKIIYLPIKFQILYVLNRNNDCSSRVVTTEGHRKQFVLNFHSSSYYSRNGNRKDTFLLSKQGF
jgi:hypothetical protein